MKNKGLFILVISCLIVVILSILHVFNLKNISNNLIDKKWYHYDNLTGYYDRLYFNVDNFNFDRPNNDNATNEYSSCSKYKYNKSTKKIHLDCGKDITVKDADSEKLILNIDSKDTVFFTDYKKSKEYEFKNYYDIDYNEFKLKNKQALDIIEIDKSKFFNLLSDKEYSKVIFIGDKCNMLECALIYDIVEKWISFSKNIFYINSSKLDQEFLNNLKNKKISNNINDYDNIYPIVYVIGGNNVIDKYEIKCLGFNCKMYYNK